MFNKIFIKENIFKVYEIQKNYYNHVYYLNSVLTKKLSYKKI